MTQTLTEIVEELMSADKNVQLIYAFNGTGKTRLSREFQKLVDPKPTVKTQGRKKKLLYYNAFTEDLFYWNKKIKQQFKIQKNKYTEWVLRGGRNDDSIIKYFQRFTINDLTPKFHRRKPHNTLTHVTFYLTRENNKKAQKVKISKGEESIFIWSIFYILLKEIIVHKQAAITLERSFLQGMDNVNKIIASRQRAMDNANKIIASHQQAMDNAKKIITSRQRQMDEIFQSINSRQRQMNEIFKDVTSYWQKMNKISNKTTAMKPKEVKLQEQIEKKQELDESFKEIDARREEFYRYGELEYVFIDDPVTSLDENHLIELAIDLAKLIKSSKSVLRFIITTHSPLFYNVLYNELNSKSCYLLENLEGGSFALIEKKGDSNASFSHHLHLLQILENAVADENKIEKYHLILLRNLYEKTANFLGYRGWRKILPEKNGDKGKYYERLINLNSHDTLSNQSRQEPTQKEKEAVKTLLQHLKTKYNYRSPQEEKHHA